ncbi:lytic murein transglycosylase [Altererythrobacter sp. RZ02]|uniref:Lytic murein transglycosylase n=1 Tax=Pontixanthobacter rizhaonensis TaxID=2730337 RepID=A0A848QL63_9SPHN|nr:lytic murein transglycosylase [Pontixanthobacter rizhaonensis]NMW31423.1 lytic murein transglycosylase [Pontixanthobacter rizhaonensis]
MNFKPMLAALAAMIVMSPATPAQSQDMSFDAYVQLMSAKARAQGVSERTITRMTAGLTPNQRVIQLDQGQPGSPTRTGYPALAPYINTHVNPTRIRRGREMFGSTRGIHPRVEEKYGVPAEILMAIWGHETNYGGYKGNFDLSRSLATLAWEGRRRNLFESEWIALLKVAEKGYSRSELVGSWAGAFGNPQFLPSVYLRLATDGDGDGRADIFNNRADTLASIARYFQDSGWRTGQPWGVRASVPSSLDRAAIENKVVSPVCPRVHERHSQWKTVAEWRQLGVRPQKFLADDVLASFFQPDGPGKPAWLLTSNYRVILEYNCSNYYAMSVGLLADEIVN